MIEDSSPYVMRHELSRRDESNFTLSLFGGRKSGSAAISLLNS